MSEFVRHMRDKDRALFDYLLEFHGELLTKREWHVWCAWVAEQKSYGDPYRARSLREMQGVPEDAEILEAANNGWSDFVMEVITRVMREHGEMLDINRCPQCGAVVRTPLARQCLWCGHDWH